jgi:hypothetical protein
VSGARLPDGHVLCPKCSSEGKNQRLEVLVAGAALLVRCTRHDEDVAAGFLSDGLIAGGAETEPEPPAEDNPTDGSVGAEED